MKYRDVTDPNRGKRNEDGIYLGYIYKYRLRFVRPKSRNKRDQQNLMEGTMECVTLLSPNEYFERNRKYIANKIGCSDPEILRLIDHDVISVSNKPR